MPLRQKYGFMIPDEVIERVKCVSIVEILANKGLTPDLKAGNQYVYRSPLTNERTASFYVDEEQNVFNDFSSGQKGDVIRLIRLLDSLSFTQAVEKLGGMKTNPSFCLSGQFPTYGSTNERDETRHVYDVRTISSPALIKYLEVIRGIPLEVAALYCSQVHYTSKAKNYYGVGFKTDSNSWAVRSEHLKTWLGSSDITTLAVPGSPCINVFEGFISFLSACVFFKKYKLTRTTIILNSISNLKRALPAIQNAECVFCYLDNDKAGKGATEAIRLKAKKIIDQSVLYPNHNDFNDFIKAIR